jgi:hypothetical protein
LICPYCTTEIEPIELSGKIFCSNCGLSIGTSQKEPEPLPKITTLKNPVADVIPPAVKTSVSAAPNISEPAKTEKPLATEPTITQLVTPSSTGIYMAKEEPKPNDKIAQPVPVQKADSTVLINELPPTPAPKPEIVEQIENAKVPNIEVKEAAKKPQTIVEEKPEPKPIENHQPKLEEKTQANNEEKISKAEKKKKLLLDILNEDNRPIRTLTEDELRPKEDTFSADVKSIDTLGASGILLDILSDQSVADSNQKEKEALKAAGDIIDKVTPAKIEDEPSKTIESKDKPQHYVPKNGKKLKIDVLDDNPVNPIKHPEIEAAEAELDLPTPEETQKETLAMTSTEESQDDQNISIENILKEETANEQPENETPFIKEVTVKEDEDIDEKLKQVFDEERKDEDIDLSDLPSVKEKAKEKGKKNQAHILNEMTSEEHQKISSKPKVGLSAEKSAHLTNYFSHIIGGEERHKKKDKKKGKVPSSHLFLYFLLVILVFIAVGILLYFYIMEL